MFCALSRHHEAVTWLPAACRPAGEGWQGLAGAGRGWRGFGCAPGCQKSMSEEEEAASEGAAAQEEEGKPGGAGRY